MILERVHARLANAGEFHQRTGLPYCTITYAQSLDGSIAAASGHPLLISGSESLSMTHHLRANHDAILVGIGTVLADDPQLTVRLVEGEHPQPIVLDTNLHFPIHARMLSNPKKPWVMTGDRICQDHKANLEQMGARILHVQKNEKGQLDLLHLLRTLGEMGIQRLMIEGGARIIAGFLACRLGNQLVVTISPRLVGGVRPIGAGTDNSTYPSLRQTVYEQWGPDMVMASDIDWNTYEK